MNVSLVKCYLGFHDWEYTRWEEQQKWVEINNYEDRYKRLIEVGNYEYPMRFCTICYKKQSRRRRDMHIYWINTNIYSIKELRFIQLNRIMKD